MNYYLVEDKKGWDENEESQQNDGHVNERKKIKEQRNKENKVLFILHFFISLFFKEKKRNE